MNFNKFLGGYVLIFYINQRNENRVNCLVLKKQNNKKHFGCYKFSLNLLKFFFVILSFFRFTKLSEVPGYYVFMLFLTKH